VGKRGWRRWSWGGREGERETEREKKGGGVLGSVGL